jgi:hypothetical protein
MSEEKDGEIEEGLRVTKITGEHIDVHIREDGECDIEEGEEFKPS